MTSSGLVISRSAVDGAEITRFQIGNISGGVLYRQTVGSQFRKVQRQAAAPEGTLLALSDGDFVSAEEAAAGLRFLPYGNSIASGSFTVKAATNDLVGAEVVMAIIAVNPVADTPSVTSASTGVNTMTAEGLVISRNTVDGSEVSHFRITNISGGQLFQNDRTTAIAEGEFITASQGASGLRFLPSPNSAEAGSFDVQAAVSANLDDLGGGVVSATITVTGIPYENLGLLSRPLTSVGTRAVLRLTGGSPPYALNGTGAEAITQDSPEFFIQALAPGNVQLVATDGSRQRLVIELKISQADDRASQVVLPLFNEAKDFRLLTIPSHLGNETELTEWLTSKYGPMSEDSWMVYGCDGEGRGDPVPLGSGELPIGPGYALWMASIDGFSLAPKDAGPVYGAPVYVDLHPGWNLIGNPYRERLNISDIQVATSSGVVVLTGDQSDTSANLWHPDPDTGEYLALQSLAPMQGAWLYSFSQSAVKLVFTPQNSSTRSKSSLLDGRSRSEVAFKVGEPLPPPLPGTGSAGSAAVSASGGGCLLKVNRDRGQK
ncbi:MAG: hypothetical protein HQL31_13475 [Planctomycetes bacterium]|nr:hypothetical protein [Planctomycetota bacterium]